MHTHICLCLYAANSSASVFRCPSLDKVTRCGLGPAPIQCGFVPIYPKTSASTPFPWTSYSGAPGGHGALEDPVQPSSTTHSPWPSQLGAIAEGHRWGLNQTLTSHSLKVQDRDASRVGSWRGLHSWHVHGCLALCARVAPLLCVCLSPLMSKSTDPIRRASPSPKLTTSQRSHSKCPTICEFGGPKCSHNALSHSPSDGVGTVC